MRGWRDGGAGGAGFAGGGKAGECVLRPGSGAEVAERFEMRRALRECRAGAEQGGLPVLQTFEAAMTPLAHRIVKENFLLPHERTDCDACNVRQKMADVHCFEVTAVHELAHSLSFDISDGKAELGELAFLPAPKTWIEFEACPEKPVSQYGRYGYLLIDNGRGVVESWHVGEFDMGGRSTYWAGQSSFDLKVFHPLFNPRATLTSDREIIWDQDDVPQEWAQIYAFLAMINTPKVIGRRQHMPHRGLEKALLREQKLIGKFPLHAWTEIRLECSPPQDLSQEQGYEAHLTGKKALHFCRAHLRLRNCRVEFVKAHWRGDPALGIKQSRYRVTA